MSRECLDILNSPWKISDSWMNACAGLVQVHCWAKKPLLLLGWLVVALLSAPVGAASPALQGYVHSTKHGQDHQPGGSYYFLVVADSPLTQTFLEHELQASLGSHLRLAGYSRRAQQMRHADVVLVARLGVRADTPSLDAVLAGEADPDTILPTGVRYLQLEAYDLPAYLEFLRQHENAAADINFQFQAWRTTVESRGLLSDYEQVLPALLQVATRRMGTEMAVIERFVWSAKGLQLGPV